jgi:hypothetical protein
LHFHIERNIIIEQEEEALSAIGEEVEQQYSKRYTHNYSKAHTMHVLKVHP